MAPEYMRWPLKSEWMRGVASKAEIICCGQDDDYPVLGKCAYENEERSIIRCAFPNVTFVQLAAKYEKIVKNKNSS